jgi:hypothetical protein
MVEPIIDPATGLPKTPPGQQPGGTPATPPDPNAPQFVQIDKGEWEGMKQKLSTFEAGFNAGRQTQPVQPPPEPKGPTLEDQIAGVEKQINVLDTQIDEAVKDGKPVSKLMQERSKLDRQITRMQIKAEDIDPVLSTGFQTLDQISSELAQSKMPYLSIPGVRKEYDAALVNFTPEQRMNPAIRDAAYRMAIGKPENFEAIITARKEEELRSVTPPQGGEPGGSSRDNGGQDGGGGGIPAPDKVLSKEALSAIKYRGLTVDQYYQKRGYKDWKDYYEKHKSYYEDTEE